MSQASQDSVFQITSTGSQLRDISPDIISVTGLPGTRELTDDTGLGVSGRSFEPELENVSFTVECFWTKTALTGTDTVFGPLRQHTSATAFDYGPEGSDSGDIKYSGSCWVREWAITSRVGSRVVARAVCQVDGTVSRGTYST